MGVLVFMCVCVYMYMCVCMCLCVCVCECDRERGLSTLPPHAHLHSGQAPALGAEEVRRKLIDENLELEER